MLFVEFFPCPSIIFSLFPSILNYSLPLPCPIKVHRCFIQGEDSLSVASSGDAANQDPEHNPEALKESIRLAEVCIAVNHCTTTTTTSTITN